MRQNKYFKERQWNNTIEEAKRFKAFVEKKAEGKLYDFELCQDLENEWISSSWKKFQNYKYEGRSFSEWLDKNYSLKKCKKSEATSLLFIGIKNENGDYHKESLKHYWLKNSR